MLKSDNSLRLHQFYGAISSVEKLSSNFTFEGLMNCSFTVIFILQTKKTMPEMVIPQRKYTDVSLNRIRSWKNDQMMKTNHLPNPNTV